MSADTGPSRDRFKDHFSGHAGAYAQFRPRYPEELFRRLSAASPGRRLAWDAGTGNGQAAVGLAGWFDAVLATDPSAQQIARATPHPRVTYRVARERDSGLEDGAADLVTAAQALHWFDLDAFWAEARRVLRPRGLIAVWCYSLPRVDPRIDAVVDHFYGQVVGPYWAPERRHIESGYRDLSFPFAEIELEPPAMDSEADLDAFCAYVATWSAVRAYLRDLDNDPVPSLHEELRGPWGAGARRIRWPLHLRAGRVV